MSKEKLPPRAGPLENHLKIALSDHTTMSEQDGKAPFISPRLPTPPPNLTSESALAWIEDILPLVDPESSDYRILQSIVRRQKFRMRNHLN